VRNTLLVVTPDGRRAGYDKIHLYDAFGFAESRTVEAGSEPVIVTVADCRVGLATCYDIRFPRLFTALARAGADLIVVPTSWGAGPGKLRQWQTLATARALDATAFVAAVGQAEPSDPAVAESGAPTGIGHSQITDPFGSVVVAYDSEPRIEVHTVDPTVVGKARTALAVLENERDIAEPRLTL
jgi:predicted amidohydrolase